MRPTYYSRATPLGPRNIGLMGGTGYEPGQARRMDREDIRNLRRWHRAAALRAKRAGFDLVYCYAGHGLSLAMHFLLRRYNDRSDEYGGSLENRVRLLRELIEDTKDAVGDSCAVAVRLAVDELLGDEGITSEGEGHEIVAMLAELPDLWDVNIAGWSNDSATSRFAQEGYQEPYIAFVKGLTSKPVVGVGRYTSPDSMVSAIRRGVLDLIGAARPSIADPFLPAEDPRRAQRGYPRVHRLQHLRERRHASACPSAAPRTRPWARSGGAAGTPSRSRRSSSEAEVLVVGAGPAGLECARALGQRGYRVALAERERSSAAAWTARPACPA